MITKNNTKKTHMVTNENNDSVENNKLNPLKSENTIQSNRDTQTKLRYKYKPFIYYIGNYSFIEWGVFGYIDTPKEREQTFIKNDIFKYLELKQC
jgi:hypothetical protein